LYHAPIENRHLDHRNFKLQKNLSDDHQLSTVRAAQDTVATARRRSCGCSSRLSGERARTLLDYMVSGQSVMQATNNTFLLLGLLTLVAAAAVWLAPKPPKKTNANRHMGH
jgi:DHA2 family multidrug resistance protein